VKRRFVSVFCFLLIILSLPIAASAAMPNTFKSDASASQVERCAKTSEEVEELAQGMSSEMEYAILRSAQHEFEFATALKAERCAK